MKKFISLSVVFLLASCGSGKEIERESTEKTSKVDFVETKSIAGCNYSDEKNLLLCAKKGDEKSIRELILFYFFDKKNKNGIHIAYYYARFFAKNYNSPMAYYSLYEITSLDGLDRLDPENKELKDSIFYKKIDSQKKLLENYYFSRYLELYCQTRNLDDLLTRCNPPKYPVSKLDEEIKSSDYYLEQYLLNGGVLMP
jgi:hypothetical protein